jgi:anti-sigma28 factor (negative regulator of flagellin synthesis)
MLIGKPVEPVSVAAVSRTGNAGAVEPGVASGKPVQAVRPVENVTLSDTSRSLTAPGLPDEEARLDKVAALKKGVEEGTYQVRAKVVGTRMIMEAAELLETLASTPR